MTIIQTLDWNDEAHVFCSEECADIEADWDLIQEAISPWEEECERCGRIIPPDPDADSDWVRIPSSPGTEAYEPR
jgi:predicted nucleic acid-binding Zn ribbon protein